MNQEKIGRLIAELRKKKGLTQSELGEMVGVGDRAVSKWERGITTPNIAIINELSKILGISSNELLAGELQETTGLTPSKNNFKTLLTKHKKLFLLIIGIIFIASITYLIFSNRQRVYILKDHSQEYNVEGRVVFTKNKAYVLIEGINFYDEALERTTIINYEYRVRSDNKLLFRSGYLGNNDKKLDGITIKDFLQNLKITFNYSDKLDYKEVVKNGIDLQISFLTPDNNTISKELKISLVKEKIINSLASE